MSEISQAIGNAEQVVVPIGIVTEDSAALAFALLHKDGLRYDHDVGKWFVWDKVRWKQNKTKLAFAWARDLARIIASRYQGKKHEEIAKMKFAAAIERGAQADQRLAVTQDYWDRDKFLLGTPGGVVDLKTGRMQPARPEDMITKITGTAPKRMPTPIVLEIGRAHV